jgi:trans-aconitate methyltransferase
VARKIKRKRSTAFLNRKILRNYELKDHILKKYMILYNRVLKHLPPVGPKNLIIDLGCGYGNFAKVLKNQGYGFDFYLGIDVSDVAIKCAEGWNPGFKFVQADLLNPKSTRKYFNPLATYIALEVLEHIPDDLAVLKILPVGSRVILSVPNFDAGSHVRFFHNEKQARARYSQIMRIETSETVDQLGNKNKFFIIVGKIKDE